MSAREPEDQVSGVRSTTPREDLRQHRTCLPASLQACSHVILLIRCPQRPRLIIATSYRCPIYVSQNHAADIISLSRYDEAAAELERPTAGTRLGVVVAGWITPFEFAGTCWVVDRPGQAAGVPQFQAAGTGFGRHGGLGLSRDQDIWSGTSGKLHWRWQGGGQSRPRPAADGRGEVLLLDLTVPAGGRHDLVLEVSEGSLPEDPPDPTETWQATESSWARSRPSLEQTIAPPGLAAHLAVLRGLTSAGGGLGAAATSLPERADGGRNYDYR